MSLAIDCNCADNCGGETLGVVARTGRARGGVGRGGGGTTLPPRPANNDVSTPGPRKQSLGPDVAPLGQLRLHCAAPRTVSNGAGQGAIERLNHSAACRPGPARHPDSAERRHWDSAGSALKL